MSFGLGFAFPAYPLRGGGGNNPFNQSGPTLDLTFAGVPTDLSDPNGYSLSTDFIVPQYQIAAQYSIWENDVGLVSKTFSQIITFSRASGATWFNSVGVLQGVDFSVTSNTIGTGSKTFTLDATGGVDRYWTAGDTVLISDQANSANNMVGTVTSYNASTQVLVCDITSTGGSGTITSWRIGSTMPRFDYDPATLAARGFLIEEARTNSIRNNTMQGAVASVARNIGTISSVSRSASATVVVAATGHTVSLGDVITVSGATPSVYNGTYSVSAVVANVSYSYVVASSATDSASGYAVSVMSPGTLPTNWVSSTTGAATSEVVGTGTENGINYIDIRFQGAGGGDTWNIIYDTTVVAANGQTWTSSVYLKLAAGSTANIPLVQRIVFRDSGFANIQAVDTSAITPTSAGLATQRSTLSLAATQAATAFVTNQLNSGTPTGAYDITIRIGLPQLEQGAFATSVIPTTTTALTRSADVASVNTLSPWYRADEGTLYGEATSTGYVLNSGFPLVASIDDGSNANRITIQQGTASTGLTLNVRSTNVSTTIADSGFDLSSVSRKIAGAYSGTSVTVSVNGSAVITGTSNGVPSGLTNMKLGSAVAGYLSGLNGHLRRVTYYPRVLSAAELQALTA